MTRVHWEPFGDVMCVYLQSDQLLFHCHCAHADYCFRLLNSSCRLSHKNFYSPKPRIFFLIFFCPKLMHFELLVGIFWWILFAIFFIFTPSEFLFFCTQKNIFFVSFLCEVRKRDHKSPVWRLPRDWSVSANVARWSSGDRFNFEFFRFNFILECWSCDRLDLFFWSENIFKWFSIKIEDYTRKSMKIN